VNISGETYWITYYKYDYKVQPNQSAPVYEYIVEKSVGKETLDVCGMDYSGNTVDLGEKEVYAYKTVVTPVSAKALDDTLTITVWYLGNASEAFLYPWDLLWMSYMSPTGATDNNFVGVQFDYRDQVFKMTNPSPFQGGLLPCYSGSMETLGDVGNDLGYLYMGWAAVLDFGIWHEWSDVNVLVPQSGAWSDMQGHSWDWSTTPDGTATYSGHTFKLVNFQWRYEGTTEGVKLQGQGKLSPELPLVIESDGHYSYRDENGKTIVIYGYMKLEDLRLERVKS
jgi:hypothetical protein